MAEPKTRDEVIAISNKVADEWRIPRLLLLACAIAEGNLKWNARRPTSSSDDARYWPDVSGGPWQQTVLYDPDYQGGQAYPGPAEVARVLELQFDVTRAAHVAASNLARKFRDGTETDDDENLVRDLFEYNWPAGKERPWTPAHDENYRRGLREARAILGETIVPTRVTFNVQEPAHIQEHDYDCSQDSLEWAMWSVGRKPADGWLDSTMQAEGVLSTANGLEDASGAGLAAFVKRHYGEFGYDANNENPVSFDALAAEIGPYPMLIGGRAWNHWSGLWGYDKAQDVLLLANPAPGWKGVGQTMNRQQFAALGPFSMVRVLHPDLLAPVTVNEPGPVAAPPINWRAEIAAMFARHDAELEDLMKRQESERNGLLAKVPAA